MRVDNRFEGHKEITEEISVMRVLADGTIRAEKRSLISEHRITVFINEKKAMTLVCTPTNLAELIIGRMISEKLVHDISDIELLSICEGGYTAKVFLKENAELHSKEPEFESCCTDNMVYLKREGVEEGSVRSERADVDAGMVFEMVKTAGEDMKLHKSTSGTHSSYLFMEGRLIFSCEDIGRHNAMDKAIGYIALNELKFSECAVFTTGRVPVDMIRKAVSAGLGLIVTKSVPTIEAVELAKKSSLSLICRAWPDGYEIY